MFDPEKEIRRKMETRKFSEQYTGESQQTEWDGASYSAFPPETVELFFIIDKQLRGAKESAGLDVYFPLQAHKRYFRGAVIFLKKAIRKLIKIFLGWYILPILDRQTRFNRKVLAAAQAMQETMTMQQKQIHELQEALHRLQAADSAAEENP